jgi:hypothetical protein
MLWVDVDCASSAVSAATSIAVTANGVERMAFLLLNAAILYPDG